MSHVSDIALIGIFILLGCIIAILIYIGLSLRRRGEPDIINAMADSWKTLGIDRTMAEIDRKMVDISQGIGTVKNASDSVLKSSQDLQTMFQVKRGRAVFGEFQLDELLADVLPRDRYKIREKISDVDIPDAHIVSTKGMVCIDAKFPLDNYRKMVEADRAGREEEKKGYQKQFRDDVEGHIAKVKDSYVKPEKGTTPFAYCFIPAEAVFQYLTEVEPTLLREAASQGVIVVSPATLNIQLNLIVLGVEVERLTKEAEEVKKSLEMLAKSLSGVGAEWGTLKTHITDTYKKMHDVDRELGKLKTDYERVSRAESVWGIGLIGNDGGGFDGIF